MSRKHFRALADEIAHMDLTDVQRYEVASGIARVCKMDNPAFQTQRFFAACGLEGW